MKRAWLRIRMWWYHICPSHGDMVFASGGGGKGYYTCPQCNNDAFMKRVELRRKMKGYYNGM